MVSNSFVTPWNCSPPGFSAHGIFQARILEWVAISFSRGSSQPRIWTCVLECLAHGQHSGNGNSGHSSLLWTRKPVVFVMAGLPPVHCRIYLGSNSQICAHPCFKSTHYMKFSIFLNSHETWASVMKSLAPHQTVLLHSPGCLLALSQTLLCKQPSKISS